MEYNSNLLMLSTHKKTREFEKKKKFKKTQNQPNVLHFQIFFAKIFVSILLFMKIGQCIYRAPRFSLVPEFDTFRYAGTHLRIYVCFICFYFILFFASCCKCICIFNALFFEELQLRIEYYFLCWDKIILKSISSGWL